MKPYYDHNGITIYHGDCLEIIQKLEPVDLVLTDPPYGKTACDWDKCIPIKETWKQIEQVIKSDAVIVMTASQPFTSKLVLSRLQWFRHDWAWDKVAGANFFNLHNMPIKTKEDIVVFAPTGKYTFNPQYTMRTKSSLLRDPPGKVRDKNYGPRSSPVQHYAATGLNQHVKHKPDGLKHPVNIIKFSVKNRGIAQYNSPFKHPSQKPVKLMEYLIQTYSNEGDMVLDFAMGSGTTLVAAKELGRKAIGIEIDEKYCEIAVRRLAQDMLPFGSNQSLETDCQKDGDRSANR